MLHLGFEILRKVEVEVVLVPLKDLVTLLQFSNDTGKKWHKPMLRFRGDIIA